MNYLQITSISLRQGRKIERHLVKGTEEELVLRPIIDMISHFVLHKKVVGYP